MNHPLLVIGGCYVEECAFPRITSYRGSGLRAAMTVAGLRNGVLLHTVLGPSLSEHFKEVAERHKIELSVTTGSQDVWFNYRHPLAVPDIYPAAIKPVEQERVTGDLLLVFGMLEGRPRVKGKKVVYDPQDGYRARPFNINGSSADELAIVASFSEGATLTGAETAEQIAAKLLQEENCGCVALKCGPRGAFVATPEDQRWVRPFASSRVWKIGSGDIFSAAFAHAWLLESLSGVESAAFASRMVAEYVSSRNESFSQSAMSEIRADAHDAAATATRESRLIPDVSIYLAGPFFTTGQQWLVDEARAAFRELGFKVFSPIHEVGIGPAGQIAHADLEALSRSKLVFAILDGTDPGTIFEVGYARGRGIPVVGVAENVAAGNLTMLLGSDCGISDDFATSIYAACWQLLGDV
ncbi:MAG: PfkB family carbohydrate kinase [Terriglobales bacterium]